MNIQQLTRATRRTDRNAYRPASIGLDCHSVLNNNGVTQGDTPKTWKDKDRRDSITLA